MIVDRDKAFYTAVEIPQDQPVKGLLLDTLRHLLESAVSEGRQPVMVEITVRVAP